MTTDLRYPIGPFSWPTTITPEDRAGWISTFAETPAKLRVAVADLTDVQLETPYRPEGWTIRQTVHHMADSHMNLYLRVRFGLTEEAPLIKPYAEAAWAELADAAAGPVELSLKILEGVHGRLQLLFASLSEEQWQRVFVHPENGSRRLEETLALYAWHSEHHLAHIANAKR
jgi:hypothetical protein